MRQLAAYRVVVLLVWGLAAYATVTCRGLFWDGSSFLVNILDHGGFHDFYVARAHVDWVTQTPVLLLAELGVRDTRLLAMAYSLALFGLPAALYHLALARVRHDAVLLGIVIAAVAVVYLPTSFFIIGEYNATFAAVTAGMAVALTTAREPPWRCGPSLRARPLLRALLRGDGLSRPAAGRRHRLVGAPRQGPRDQGAGRHRGAGLRRRRRGLGRDHRRVLEPSALHQGAVDERRLLAESAVRHPDRRACDLRGGRAGQAGLAAGARAAHRHGRGHCRAGVDAVVAAAARALHSLSAGALPGAPGGRRAAGPVARLHVAPRRLATKAAAGPRHIAAAGGRRNALSLP